MGQIDGRSHDRGVVRVVGEVAGERLVDFHLVRIELPQHVEGAVPGAEVVHGEAYTEITERGKGVGGCRRIHDDRSLGDFQRER